MAQLVWKEARSQAKRLLGTATLDRGGDPYEISEQLGIAVHTVTLPPGVSGMIVKEDGEDAEIFLSAQDIPSRRRFTCAHELGHFIERTQVAKDEDFSFRDERSTKYNLHEFFADEFAGELLMPDPVFSQLVAEGLRSADLSRRYGVSVAAVDKRKARLLQNPGG